MTTIEEKIQALSALMSQGVLTADEFAKIVQVLNGTATEGNQIEKTPEAVRYEDYIENHILPMYKSPGTCKYPELESSMIKEEEITLASGFKRQKMHVRYIETWVDATNSYGAYLRKNFAIVVDDGFVPQYAMEKLPSIGKNTAWMKMAGVK